MSVVVQFIVGTSSLNSYAHAFMFPVTSQCLRSTLFIP